MECKFETCEREVLARGLCKGHYQQDRAGKELKPLQPRNRFTAPEGYKVCTACLKVKTVDEFYTRPDRNLPRSNCKECMIEKATEVAKSKADRLKALEAQIEATEGLGSPSN